MTQQELLQQVETFLKEQKTVLLPVEDSRTFEQRRRWDHFLKHLNDRIIELGDRVAGY